MSNNKLQDTLRIASTFLIEEEGGANYKTDEGWKVYEDPVVKKNKGETLPTVGPGLTGKSVVELAKMKVGEVIPHEKVQSLFEDTLKTINTNLGEEFKGTYSSLASNEQAALISLIYNVGLTNFKTGGKEEGTSKAYRALKEGKYDAFKKETFDANVGFVRSGGVIIKGLQNRRRHELNLFNKGLQEKNSGGIKQNPIANITSPLENLAKVNEKKIARAKMYRDKNWAKDDTIDDLVWDKMMNKSKA